MGVVVVCSLLLLAGLAVIVWWGGTALRPPEPQKPKASLFDRFVWWLTVAAVSGVGAGILVAGPGGRLVMRLLAITSGLAAKDRLTEAGATVGHITADGTVAVFLFGGLPIGALSGAIYVLIRRGLPTGRLGGVVYGVLLLALAITVDPLRPDNVDFDLLEPAWLAVLAFAPLVVAHGMVVAALAGRISRALPLLTAPGAGRRYLLLLPFILGLVLTAPLFIGFIVSSVVPPQISIAIVLLAALLALGRSLLGRVARTEDAARRERTVVLGGRLLVGLVILAALFSFVVAVADIVTSA
jgi:hypothetical protein